MKVYCDNGGYRKELKDLERQGRVVLLMFPYENINRKIGDIGQPSEATWKNLENFTWETLPGTFGDYEGSEKVFAIEKVIGRHNRVDVLHLDSAFKSDCSCFLTRDKDDILSHGKLLTELLGMRFFHSDEEWNDFLIYLSENSK